jgi:hypothetical protein
VKGDRTGENDETVFLNHSNPKEALITRQKGAGVILDDDRRR